MSETIPGMISVIIPTYNRRGMLLELLDTIRAQDYPSVEILVVDDGSSDGTSAAMEKLPVRYFRNERNSGPGFSRKRGFQEARGEYVGRKSVFASFITPICARFPPEGKTVWKRRCLTINTASMSAGWRISTTESVFCGPSLY